MLDWSLRRRSVDGRDEPGHDDRGSEAQPGWGRSLGERGALMADTIGATAGNNNEVVRRQ
ncbi:MAG TPA: hypothetical protein VGG77_06130 [Roseiarcus sp.]